MQKSEPPAEDGATHDPVPGSAREAVERLAAESRGRLLALLAAAVRDLALAEDGLADAFERALRTWSETGVPQRPEAWLMTVARNRIRDHLGSAAARSSVPMDAKVADVQSEDSTARLDAVDVERIPDKRLELLFACAHPTIAETMRTPLMLQVVFGCDAAEVARLYGVPTATMAQRLVRTKRRIRDAGIPFHIPTREDMLARLAAVLEAIYGAYASDWLDQRDASGSRWPTRRGGWRCWSPSCWETSPRRGGWPRCSPSPSRALRPVPQSRGRPSRSRTPPSGTPG
nr:sigma factor [Nesterenkonia sp. PF2B19]